MPIEKTGPGSYSLLGGLTISTAEKLSAELTKLPLDNDLTIDLSGVDRVDAAGIQLLLYIKLRFKASGKKVKFKAHPSELTQTLCLLGLVGRFGDRITMPSSEIKSIEQSYGLKREPLL